MRECWNWQTGTFEVRVSLTYGFKSRFSHQTQIIRTKSSLWEMGSDYLFSLRDLKIRIFAMEWSSGLNPNREGRGS